MIRGKVALLAFLQLVVFIVGTVVGSEMTSSPITGFSYTVTFLAASYRPLWKGGRILDRAILFSLALLAGLSVRHFIGWLATYLFTEGIFDAGGAATVAGYRAILAVLTAYIVTRLNIAVFTDWVAAKWNTASPSRLSLIAAGILAPYLGLIIAGVVVHVVIEAEVVEFVLLVSALVSSAVLIGLYTGIYWALDRPLFGLRGATAEGPRRLALLLGWVVGMPLALLILGLGTDWFDDEETVFAIPVVGLGGLMTVFLLVHAVFWALEGFRPRERIDADSHLDP